MQNIIEVTDHRFAEDWPEDWDLIVNSLKVVTVDQAPGTKQKRREHTRMYVPMLVSTTPRHGGKVSVTMALPDSGNLLAHTAIDEKFHQQLGVPMLATNIWARAANKQSMEIRGVSQGIYIRFPKVRKTFFVKPLIIKNLSCKLNLGAQFNHQTGFILQRVTTDKEGKKMNFSELDGIRI